MCAGRQKVDDDDGSLESVHLILLQLWYRVIVQVPSCSATNVNSTKFATKMFAASELMRRQVLSNAMRLRSELDD